MDGEATAMKMDSDSIIAGVVVSEGTLRNCDLVPKFHDFLVDHGAVVPFGLEPEAFGNPDHPWWKTGESAEYMTQLFLCMNELAPKGYYFGSHTEDIQRFGFWEYPGLGCFE